MMKVEKETSNSSGTVFSKQQNDTQKQPIIRANSTVLTNLQRGNTKAQQNTCNLERTIYVLAAQGELTQHNIKNYLDKLNQPDSNGYTALHWAAFYGQLSTCKLLVKNGLKVSDRGNNGETALLFASANGHLHVVKFLLNNKANINEYDDHGNTALIYSTFNNHELIVQTLLDLNCDFTIENINLETAYTIAVQNKNRKCKLLIEKHILKNLFQKED